MKFQSFARWTIEGLFQGSVIYIYTQGLYKASEKGGPFDLGIACYTAIVLIVTARLTVETSYWTWISHFAIWGTIFMYIVFGLVYSSYIWTFLGAHAGDLYWIVHVSIPKCLNCRVLQRDNGYNISVFSINGHQRFSG